MDRTPEAYTRGILAAVLEPWIDGLGKVGTESSQQTLRLAMQRETNEYVRQELQSAMNMAKV